MKLYICLIMVFISSLLFSQSRELIMRSNDYYYGEATANVYQEAKDRAIKDLSEKIIVNVRISTINQSEESNLQTNEFVQSVIETYSIATFKNLQEIRTPVSKRINVFVYIKKSDLNEIFEERKQLIYDIYQQALLFEENTNIGHALKYLYYSIILMNSLPDERLVFHNVPFHTVLPGKIREIISRINLKVISSKDISDSEKQIILAMSYKDKAIQFIRFHFWDGNNQVYIEGKDGKAVISLFGATRNLRKIDAIPDFSYYEQRSEFKAVADLWDIVKKPDFSQRIEVILENIEQSQEPAQIALIDLPKEVFVEEQIMHETQKFIDFIKENNLLKLKSVFPNDKFIQEKITALIKYNNIQIVDTHSDVLILPVYNGFELRSIPVIARYHGLNKQTTDSLVLDFDENGKLTDIQFTVFDGMLKLAMQNVNDEKEMLQRKTLVKFVEKYRSAFLYRDLKTLETLFSDDAVIIVGRVMQTTPKIKDYKYTAFGNQPDIEYINFTKEEYLRNLRNIFNSNQDIHLGYNSFKIVTKNNAPGVYAVSMRQNYSSSRYSDEGYLFLLIDFNEDLPKIYVRSWQPGEWADEKMIEMSNFRLH